MAAPANTKCEKCFATVPAGATTCPDCGAPVAGASVSDSEAAIYPELAKANLARMRGDYKQAEEQLLSVLKRYPNNPSANEMLGDLAAERDDFEHAIQWYELALEIVPTSASIARKLKDARSRIDKKQAADTTAQLGISDPTSRMPWVIGALLLLIVIVAAGGYLLGSRGNGGNQTPIHEIKAEQQQAPATTGGVAQEPQSKPPAQAEGGVAEDRSALDAVSAKAEDATSLLEVTHIPRAGVLIVTFSIGSQDRRALAARLARDAFAAMPGYNTVTLRGVGDGKVAYMADVDRAVMAQTQSDEWKAAHQNDPGSWISTVLQNEWPAAGDGNGATTATAGGSADPNAPSSTGGTDTSGAPGNTTGPNTTGGG